MRMAFTESSTLLDQSNVGTRAVFLACALSLAAVGCSPGQSGGSRGGGGPGGDTPVGASRDGFVQFVQPLLTEHCAGCHTDENQIAQRPYIAHTDGDTAYSEVMAGQYANLVAPRSSRLVVRLDPESHNCWDNSCLNSANEMTTAITNWANTSGTGGQTDLLELTTPVAMFGSSNGSARDNSGAIAFYDFKAGMGETAFDRSGVAPAIDLTLVGTEWVPGGGIQFPAAATKAFAPQETSVKLFNRIADANTGSQAYSVEAWVIPENNAQDGPARIVNYSVDTGNRNFGTGQVGTYYIFRNRSPNSNNNGSNPNLRTPDNSLATSIQHVVATFDQQNGRRLYIDGQLTLDSTTDPDPTVPTTLDNWNNTYRLILGNEHTDDRQWLGQILLVAIYDKSLTQAQIATNFTAGIGESFVINFDISDLVNQPQTYIRMEASPFDSYGYLFGRPTLLSSGPLDAPIRNMRIAVNDVVPVAGQSFSRLNETLTSDQQLISGLGAVIKQDLGSEQDTFRLAFEVIGDRQNLFVEPVPSSPPLMDDGQPATAINGVRTFDQINDTMSSLTGIDKRSGVIGTTFDELRTQFPVSPAMASFVAGQQVAVNKLALEYCDAMVNNAQARAAIFGNFNFGATVSNALDAAGQSAVTNALWDNMVGSNMARQPDESAFKAELNALLSTLVGNSPNGDAVRTRSVVAGACTAVLASSVATVH